MEIQMANWPHISTKMVKESSMCFACGPDNPIGLKLRFDWDGKTARAEFTPSELHQGWSRVVHGGIIACLLDEAMSYATLFEGAHAVTARMEVRIKRPIPIDEPLTITGNMTKKTRKLVETKAAILLKDGTPVAEATGTHFVVGKGSDETEPT
jgi:uncharacterized protein (TIGR00369 family)